MNPAITDFLTQRPIFRIEEIQQHYQKYVDNPAALSSLLSTYKRRRKIGRIISGLYFSVDYWKAYERIDPYVIASKLARDAVIGYHSAVAFHLKGAINPDEYVLVTAGNKMRSGFHYQNVTYRAVSFPQKLVDADKIHYAVESVQHHGIPVRLTQLERSWVDMVDRPYLLQYNWAQITRYIEAIPSLDVDGVVEYVKLLGQSFIAAKVGHFMERMRERWGVQEAHLEQLDTLVSHVGAIQLRDPEAMAYRLSPRWRILVPDYTTQQRQS